MGRKRLTLLFALLASVVANGCTSPGNMQTARLNSIRAGMTRGEVLEILGPPQRQERHGSTEFFIYSTDGASPTALLDFTPIAIVDGRVTGTGRSLYQAIVEADSKHQADR